MVSLGVDGFLAKHPELGDQYGMALRELCREPFPKHRPKAIRHLRGRLLCSFRLRIGKYRLHYEVDSDTHEISILGLNLRDAIYEKR